LYGNSHESVCKDISGVSYTDNQISDAIIACYKNNGYLLDPHGACGYQALKSNLADNENGIFLETAHPAKFAETVENIIGKQVKIPEKLQEFMRGTKKNIAISKEFKEFKEFLFNKSN